jgi:hypothetical protein
MHTPRRFVAAGLTILLVATFAFLAQPATASTARPTWAAGDFWLYSYRASALGTTYSGSLRLDVVGSESVTLNGTAYSSYRVKATIAYDFGGASLTYKGDVWYTTDSLAIAQISITVNISGSLAITIWGNPPQHINWPLSNGDSWSSATDITIKEVLPNGTAMSTYTRLSTTFTVLADASVTVPAGTFMTTPVKESMTGSTFYNVNYWSPQAGNSVRSESYNGTSGPSGGYNLTDYKYQNGNFFTSVFVGLPVWIWLVLLVVIAAVVGIAVAMRRRRTRTGPPPPGWSPPQEPPTGPPPGSPP